MTNKKIINIIIAVLILLFFIFLNIIYPNIIKNNNVKYINNELKVSHGRARIIKEDNLSILFEVSEKTRIIIPRIYNIGYKLYSESDKAYKIFEDKSNFIAANIDKGVYELKYVKSIYIRIINTILTIILIICLYYLIDNKVKLDI